MAYLDFNLKMLIKDINVKIILDSRGKETLEAVMHAERCGMAKAESQKDEGENGDISASASVPSGKSTGSRRINDVLNYSQETIDF